MDTKMTFLVLLLVVLGFCVYATRKRKGWSNLFLGFFVLLGLLLLVEFVYRNFFAAKKTLSTVNSFYTSDAHTGFKWKDTGRVRATEYFVGGDTVFDTWYTFLSDTIGNGGNYPFREGFRSDTGKSETVFLGCSFTFGECLPDEETLPYQYGRLTGTSAVNRACNGFGIHQVYQTFNLKYANQDNHNRVFVYPFLADHIVRANCIYKWNIAGPYFVVSGDSLVDKGPLSNFKKIRGLRLEYYGSFFGELSFIKDKIENIAVKQAVRNMEEEDVDRCYMMLRQMAKKIQATGGKFIVLDWDNGYSKNKNSKFFNQDTVNARINREVIPFNAKVLLVSKVIDPANPAFIVPNNGHPSALANRVLATYLEENIKQEHTK